MTGTEVRQKREEATAMFKAKVRFLKAEAEEHAMLISWLKSHCDHSGVIGIYCSACDEWIPQATFGETP